MYSMNSLRYTEKTKILHIKKCRKDIKTSQIESIEQLRNLKLCNFCLRYLTHKKKKFLLQKGVLVYNNKKKIKKKTTYTIQTSKNKPVVDKPVEKCVKCSFMCIGIPKCLHMYYLCVDCHLQKTRYDMLLHNAKYYDNNIIEYPYKHISSPRSTLPIT